MKETAQTISFLLNGKPVRVSNPKPTDLLIDYLRSAPVNLTGTKLSCGEGGCGACTVLWSYTDASTGETVHKPVNSCLRPVCSLEGTAITTIEGISTPNGSNIIEQNMLKRSASQCGYCSPGFVMTMYGLLQGQHPDPQAVEDQFAGNICRCTGYISILKAMHDTRNELNVTGTGMQEQVSLRAQTLASFEPITGDGYQYLRPTTIEETLTLLNKFQDALSQVKLLQGNTSIGIYKRTVEDPHILIDLSKLTDFKWIRENNEEITLAGGVTIARLLEHIDDLGNLSAQYPGIAALRDHIRLIASAQVRSVASVAGSLMLVKNHEFSGTPFPGDLFTVLSLLKAKVTILTPDGKSNTYELLRFPPVQSFTHGFLITSIHIPCSKTDELVKTYRVARRTQNSHPIVNAAFCCTLTPDLGVSDIRLVYGGLARIAVDMPRTQALLSEPGTAWGPGLLQCALPVLSDEIEAAIVITEESLFPKDYLKQLALNLFYKFYVYVCNQKQVDIAAADRSAGISYVRPLASGTHQYLIAPFYDGQTGQLNKIVHFQESAPQPQVTLKNIFPATIPATQVVREEISNISLVQRTPQEASISLKELTPQPNDQSTTQALTYVQQKLPTKIDAPAQVNGTAKYTHDLNHSADTQEAFYVYSTHRNAQFAYAPSRDAVCIELETKFYGARFIHQGDIPTQSPAPSDFYDPANPGNYDPIFAKDFVTCYGMPIGVVVAADMDTARAGAEFVQSRIVYTDMPEDQTFDTLQKAVAHNSILKSSNNRIPFIFRPIAADDPQKEEKMKWMNEPFEEPGRTYVSGRQSTGAQYHFYMEPQGALAIPREDLQIEIYSSTQNQSSVQRRISALLQQPMHNVKIGVTRLGGGFGGKELRQVFVAGAAAIAAWTLQKPVRLLLNRNIDMRVMGTRHPFDGNYYLSATSEGRIEKMRVDYRSDGGISYDCSFPVMDLALLCAENAYYVDTFKTTGQIYRTNIQSRTAFRSFGLIQSMLITETALEHLAFSLNMRPDELRALNFYRDGQAVGAKPQYTPYGSPLPYCRINQVWGDFKTKIDFEARLQSVQVFNKANRWRKRGLSIIPLKYGISYTFRPMNQGSAYVLAYKEDGSVLLHHGGVEMGQGMQTKMVQIAAEELGINMEMLRIGVTNTAVIPNVSSTGASTGSDLNGYAVRRACQKLKAILGAFLNDLVIDEQHTQYPDVVVDSDTLRKYIADMGGNWKDIVKLAAAARISLSAQYSFASPNLGSIPTSKRENYQITPINSQIFYYYNYCVAASEVEIDVLTGQFEILRSDIVYDAGDSLNDNIDYGQVEGGFIQGVGYLTMEEMIYGKEGSVISDGTWEYKPPCTKTIPQQFNVYLLKYESSGIKTDPPKDSYGIQSSKSTGEPPLVLSNSVFFAIRSAVHEARKDAGTNDWFDFTAPATVQKIQSCCLTNLGSVAATL